MANNSAPRLPPFSNTASFKFRRSKSLTYDNTSPEWFWKLSPILPQLWIRDASQVSADIVADLEQAWLKYVTLNIPGKGDGTGLSAYTRSGRKKLEDEYARLDDDTRRAKEVALARFQGFTIRGIDGTLDYHTEVRERKVSGAGVGGVWKRIRKKMLVVKMGDWIK